MSAQASTSAPLFARLTATAKNSLFKTTIAGDLNPLQNAEFCKAMSVFFGSLGVEEIDDENRPYYDALYAYGHELPGDQLDDDARPVYRVLSAMKAILEDLDQILEQYHDEIGSTAQGLLEKQGSAVAADIERYIEHVPARWRKFWLIVAFGSLIWQSSLVKGPDPSFIPLRVPVLIRSTAIFSDWILHPTANNRQLRDMFTQRLLTAAPQQMLYTVAMITALKGGVGIYEASYYQPINIALALGAVTAVIGATEWTAYRTRQKAGSGAQRLVPYPDEDQRRIEVRERLTANAGKWKVVQSWAKRLRERHSLSPGENNAFGGLMEDIDQLLETLTALAQRPKSGDNPEFAEKLEPVYVCSVFALLQILSSTRNQISLGLGLSWSEYALYRLIKSATAHGRGAEETWKLLDQIGGIVPAQLFLHSLPLVIDSDAFKREWLVTFSTMLLSVLQTTVSHKTGPWVSAGSKSFIRGTKPVTRFTGRQLRKLPYRRLLRLLRFYINVARAWAGEGTDVQGVELQPPAIAEFTSLLSSVMTGPEAAQTSETYSFWEAVKKWEEIVRDGREDGEGEDDDEPLWMWVKDMEERDVGTEKELFDPIWEWVEKDGSLTELLRAWRPERPLFDKDDEFAWMDDLLAATFAEQEACNRVNDIMAELFCEIDAQMENMVERK